MSSSSSSSPGLLLLFFLHLLLLIVLPSPPTAAAAAAAAVVQSNGTTIYDLLPQYGLPPGILPDIVKSYSVDSNGQFVAELYAPCYVDFEYVIYYETRVTGLLSYGAISALEGVQIRSYYIWYGVSAVMVDLPSSEFVYLQFGWVTRKLSIDQFQTIHSCRASLSLFQRAKKVARSMFETIFAPQV